MCYQNNKVLIVSEDIKEHEFRTLNYIDKHDHITIYLNYEFGKESNYMEEFLEVALEYVYTHNTNIK